MREDFNSGAVVIYQDKELREEIVVRNFRTTASDGKNYNIAHYNLVMVKTQK